MEIQFRLPRLGACPTAVQHRTLNFTFSARAKHKTRSIMLITTMVRFLERMHPERPRRRLPFGQGMQ